MGFAFVLVLVLAGCGAEPELDDDGAELDDDDGAELGDDAYAYVSSRAYRRAILERDLVRDTLAEPPIYARVRLRYYSTDAADSWDALPLRDWASLPITSADAAQIHATQALPTLEFGPALGEGLSAEALPSERADWISLGERVLFEFPMAIAPAIAEALRAGVDLRDYGLLVHDGAYVGLRFVEHEGRTTTAITCATCHVSLDAEGRPSPVRANRNFDFGRLRLDFGLVGEEAGVDATANEHLALLGPGRSDVLGDGEFNPYAFPDFGGIADIPYLHHTANWYNRGVATLAIRVETVFLKSGPNGQRPPRALMWALAEYLRSLPPPPASEDPSPASERGRELFAAAGCEGCHTPPLYSSATRVRVDALETDAAAGLSPLRGTGYWRVPSLRGVGGNAPYLHHGAFATLEQMFDPGREEPGHWFGLELSAEQRADLLAFLRTI